MADSIVRTSFDSMVSLCSHFGGPPCFPQEPAFDNRIRKIQEKLLEELAAYSSELLIFQSSFLIEIGAFSAHSRV